jgi:hypothetical protein
MSLIVLRRAKSTLIEAALVHRVTEPHHAPCPLSSVRSSIVIGLPFLVDGLILRAGLTSQGGGSSRSIAPRTESNAPWHSTHEPRLLRATTKGKTERVCGETGNTSGVRTVGLLIAMVFASLDTPGLCFAQVKLPSVNLGFTSFEDGFAGRGLLLEEFPAYYDADKLKDSQGITVPGLNHLTTFSSTSHIAYVSPLSFLGGQLSAEALLPWVDVDALVNGASSRVRGFADLTVAGGVQWAPRQVGSGVFVHRLMLSVGLPTAPYDDTQPVNLSNNFVVVDPYYAVTYELPKLEISARLHYLWNSVNHEPFVGLGAHTVQPGQAFHMNYSASYEVITHLRVGFNGYWLQQTTDDKVNDNNLPHSFERTVGLGAGIQYFSGRQTWIHLNGYKETDVRNRAEGFSVTLRLTRAIPSARSHP